MKIPNSLGMKIFWNPFWRPLTSSDSLVGSSFSDWQVIVSREKEVLQVRQMPIDMPNTRLKPIYSAAGELTIVVLAESKKAAENRGHRIASRIADAGLWGLDFLDLVDLHFDQ